MSHFVSFFRGGLHEGDGFFGWAQRSQNDGAEFEVIETGVTYDPRQFGAGEGFWLAGVQFGFEAADALCNEFQAVFEAMAQFVFQVLPLEGAQELDFVETFVVPAAEGGFGDAEFGRDFVEA